MSHFKHSGKLSTVVYAVRAGWRPGVYDSWDECCEQVRGYRRAQYRKFRSRSDAEAWIATGASPPPTKTERVCGDSDDDVAQFTADEHAGHYRVWTDGACPGNGQSATVGGIGVWWGRDDHPRNVSQRVALAEGQCATNQLCELTALARALEQAVALKESGALRHLDVYTDSSYALHAVTKWVDSWSRRGWTKTDGKPVCHRALMQRLIGLRDALQGVVAFHHVRGHSGDRGNDAADALAVAACSR